MAVSKGHWWDDGTSQPALEGFACGACVQVVKPPYSRHQEQLRGLNMAEQGCSAFWGFLKMAD